MQEPVNPMKQALVAGAPAFGIWCSLGSAVATEVVAGSGADWILIDSEHSPNDLRSTLAQLHAAAAYPACEAMVRVATDEPKMIQQMLDTGARSIMVPNVRTAAQAEAIVAAMTYPPGGVRGFSGTQRANAYGRIAGYLADPRAQQFLAVQIECPTGVANAAAIAAVPGVDALFVGPGDLSATLGHFADPAAPPVQAAIASALAATRAQGKVAGILATDPDDIRRYLDAGFTMVAIGSDLGLLARGSDDLVAQFKAG